MGFFDDLKDLKFPTSVQVYHNKETGEFAYELTQPKNVYNMPTHVKYYQNPKRGVTVLSAKHDEEEPSDFFSFLFKKGSDASVRPVRSGIERSRLLGTNQVRSRR